MIPGGMSDLAIPEELGDYETEKARDFQAGYEQGRHDAARAIERLPIFTMLVVNRFDAVAVARGEQTRGQIDVRPD